MIVASSLPAVYAAQPSGLKDVELEQSVTPTAKVDVTLETLAANLVVNSDIQYTIRLKAGTEKTSAFTITATCGDIEKVDEVVLAENTSYEHTYTLDNCPNGAHLLRITVVADGAEVATYSKNITVTPIVQRYYLDEVTSKLGFNTPYDNPTYRNTMMVNGVRAMRTEMGRWSGRETKKGVYDFTPIDNYIYPVTEMDIESLLILGMNNDLYMDSGTGNGPDSKTNIDGFGKYAAAVAKQYPHVKHIEVWNEPNISFWTNPNSIDYAYTSEVAYREVQKVNPDARIMIGSTASGDSKFIMGALNQGIWGSVDTVSYHPYTRPSGVDVAMAPLTLAVHDAIVAAGGWKVPICSEIGWPSNNIGIGTTPELQAIELAKVHIFETSYGVPMTIIHNTFDTSWDLSESTECHYGIVYPDWTPKPSFYTTREVNNQMNGSVHVGKVFFEENPDIQMHLLARDGKLHAAIWTKGETVEIDMGQSVQEFDMIGNPVNNDSKVTLTQDITYLHGLTDNWIVKGLSDTMKEIYNDAIGNLDDCNEMTGFAKAKEMVYSVVDKTASMTELPSEEEALKMLNEHYQISSDLIDMYANGELDIPFTRLTGLMYINQMMGEKMTNLYMLSIDSDTDYSNLTSDAAVKEADAFINEKRADNTLSGAEAIWKFAKERKDYAYQIAAKEGTNEMKSGYVKATDVQATILANLAKKLAEAEKPGYSNVLLQLPSSQAGIDLGKEQNINLSLYNYRTNTELTGYAEIYAPDGNVVGKSEIVTLEPDTSVILPAKILVSEAYDGEFSMKFFEGGEPIIERMAPVVVKDQVKVKFASMMKKFDEIDSITINIENVYDKDIVGKISVTPRCDWTLAVTEQELNVKKGEKISVTYPVSTKTKEPFNFYTFDVQIHNNEGDLIYNKYMPIDFTVISRAEREMSVADFDGDISDWSDAYPIYADTPQNPEDYAEWQAEDVGARMMMKWDENYFYLLCDVYDQFHANMQMGSNIWNGDSLQLAWDTLNDDSSSYDANDYEYGFALTENGVQVYTWNAGPVSAGERPVEWTTIFHSHDEHMTRYFMRVPAGDLAPMVFEEENVIGFNFLVNDADFTTREKDIEYTAGISVHKDTSYYDNFRLVGVEEQVTGEPKIPLPLNLDFIKKSESHNSAGAAFEDVKGHWAEEYITQVANIGGLSGMGDGTFKPDKCMTRAEFVTALAKCAGLDSAVVEKVYSDVSVDAWYAKTIFATKKAGWIPEEMGTSNFYPNEPITRQEVVYLAARWLDKKDPLDVGYIFMADMKDVSEISEYARESFQTLFNYKVIMGDDRKMLNPNDCISRAEAATVLAKMINL